MPFCTAWRAEISSNHLLTFVKRARSISWKSCRDTQGYVAISALDCGLLPITQTAMYFDGVGMHEYESVAIDIDEQERLVRDLGSYKAMILRNHGLLAVGPTVAEAFTNLFWLERACKAQVAAMSCNTKLHLPAQDVIEKTTHLSRPETRRRWGPLEWPALLRLADRKYPGFRD